MQIPGRTMLRNNISGNMIVDWGTGGTNVWGIILRADAGSYNVIENNTLVAVTSGERGINLENNGGADTEYNIVKQNRVKCFSAQKLVVLNSIVNGGTNLSAQNYDLETMRGLSDQDSTDQYRATSMPTSGTWERGDIVWKSNSAPGYEMGWACVSSGTPGSWAKMPNFIAI
jgi:hypothetical protein